MKPTCVESTARFNVERTHRYRLVRRFSTTDPARSAMFLMLNPSTADETKPDPTITRCMGFTRAWGYDQLDVCNLFSLRSPDPHALLDDLEPDGGAVNGSTIVDCARRAAVVVAAWGGPYAPLRLARLVADRARQIESALLLDGIVLHCLARTKDGHPRHPLYLKANLRPIVWRAL